MHDVISVSKNARGRRQVAPAGRAGQIDLSRFAYFVLLCICASTHQRNERKIVEIGNECCGKIFFHILSRTKKCFFFPLSLTCVHLPKESRVESFIYFSLALSHMH